MTTPTNAEALEKIVKELDDFDKYTLEDEINQVRAALQDKWMPIETFPKKGKPETLVADKWGFIKHVRWSEDMGGCFEIIDYEEGLRLNPEFIKWWMYAPPVDGEKP